MQSMDNLVEKRIESTDEFGFVVLASTIIAYSSSLKFEQLNPKDSRFIRVSGEGSIYVETFSDKVRAEEPRENPNIEQAAQTLTAH